MIAVRYIFFVSCLLLAIHHQIYAQWREPRLTHLGPEDGISSWTFAITQDSTGYMYFGTDQGLVRYDGNTFELFAHIPGDSTSIGPGDVWSLYAGSHDQIWIGTRLSGLNVFNPKTKKFNHYTTPNKINSDYDAVFSIYEDANQHIWVGGENYSLHRFDIATKTFKTYQPDWILKNNAGIYGNITAIFQDHYDPDLLWLSMIIPQPGENEEYNISLVSFNTKTNSFKHHPCSGTPKYQDEDGQLWLASKGIIRFNPKTAHSEHFPVRIDSIRSGSELMIKDIIPYNNDFIIASDHTIMSMSREGKIKIISHDEALGRVEDIYMDGQDNVWFGRNKGVTVLSSQEELIKFFSLEKFGVSRRIYPGRLAYDPIHNNLFVVVYANNAERRQVISISLVSGQASPVYTSEFNTSGITIDDDSRLWINSHGQMNYMEYPPGATLSNPVDLPCIDKMPNVWNMSTSRNGWIGGISKDAFIWFNQSLKECHVINEHNLTLASDGEYSPGFQGMSFTKGDKALIFSNEVFEVDLHSGAVITLKTGNGVNPYPKTEINSVIEDIKGHIWIATLAMTAEFERDGDSLHLIKKYSTKDGMGSAWVHELFPDQSGRVWAFAQNGLNAIDPDMQEVRLFGVREGLADPYADPRQVLLLKDGSIATVNGNGVIIFHPDSLWNGYTPTNIPVALKEIRTSGKTIVFENDVNNISTLVLKPYQDNIDIQFQGLAYPTDYNLTYSYKVEGLNEDWISIGENKIVTLSALRPGDYTIRIKAGTGSSPAPEKVLHLFLATPLPQKSWFIGICVMALISILYLGYKRRIGNIRKQEEEKLQVTKQMADLELKALRSQMNPHFMFNSLNSIKNYILQAEPKLAAEYLSNFSHLIRMILQNSSEKEISLQDELETLILYIELEQIRFERKFKFNCVIEDGLRLESIRIPPMILQPYIENAIWHGLMQKREEGHLLLSFSKENEMICCMIDDDGIGRKKSAEIKNSNAIKYKSMGMGITRDRIDILNKMNALGIQAEIIDKLDDSGLAIGTRVIVKIPGSND